MSWYDAVAFCNKLSVKEGRRPYYRIAGISRAEGGWIKDATVTIEGGDGYRLPTEAEWEYACRAGTKTPFSFGSENNGTLSNCKGDAPYGTNEKGPMWGRTVPVGSYRPNAFGLYDMHGNVWEWCWDIADNDYYTHAPASDPAGPSTGRDRVTRGGSWGSYPNGCRSACRGSDAQTFASDNQGFRIARGVEK
jgi:formylglycine-generating enzyme required for sulfatase activity